MILLRKPMTEDADELFPMIHRTPITDTILWDGPDSLDSYRKSVALRQEQTQRGEAHWFVIVETETKKLVGSIDIRPETNPSRADIGLWVGKPYQGKGYGTEAVKEIVEYGFKNLGLQKIEASVFVGNVASRKIFERNDFILEGTIRKKALKRGYLVDEWLFGLARDGNS